MPKSSELTFAMGNEVPFLSETIAPGQHPAAEPLANGDMQSSWNEVQMDLFSILQPLSEVRPEADPWGSPDLGSGNARASPVPRSSSHVEDVHDSTRSADIDVDDGQDLDQHTTVMLEEEGFAGPQHHTDALILPHPSKARVARAVAESLMLPHGAGNRERAHASLPSNPSDLVSALEKANRFQQRWRPQPDGMRPAASRQPPSNVTPSQSHMAQHEASSAGAEPPEQCLRAHIESFEAGSHSECLPVEEVQDPPEDIDRLQDTICWMSIEDLELASMGHG